MLFSIGHCPKCHRDVWKIGDTTRTLWQFVCFYCAYDVFLRVSSAAYSLLRGDR